MSTDRLRTSPLDAEHLDEDRLLPERVLELEAAGHPVDVLEHHLVVNDKPDDDSTGYLVAEIETTPVPDESAAPITLFVCHCAHAHYRVFNWSSVGGPDGADPGDDKHVDRVLRSEKREREVDDDQVTLADGGQLLEEEMSAVERADHLLANDPFQGGAEETCPHDHPDCEGIESARERPVLCFDCWEVWADSGNGDGDEDEDGDGPGLEGATTGYSVECRRRWCDYEGPMNIQRRASPIDSKTLELCPECGIDNSADRAGGT